MKIKDMTEEQVDKMMRACGGGIVSVANKLEIDEFAFLLLCFEKDIIGSGGTTQYISNCERKGMIKALRETADRLESLEDINRQINILNN